MDTDTHTLNPGESESKRRPAINSYYSIVIMNKNNNDTSRYIVLLF